MKNEPIRTHPLIGHFGSLVSGHGFSRAVAAKKYLFGAASSPRLKPGPDTNRLQATHRNLLRENEPKVIDNKSHHEKRTHSNSFTYWIFRELCIRARLQPCRCGEKISL
jgi:hypothetical protein